MANLINSIRQRFTPIRPLPAGLYSYTSPASDPRNYRLHLRIDPGGDGILIVNASTVLHLNQTAAEYCYHLLKNNPVHQVARQVANRYRITEEQARNDYQELIQQVLGVVEQPDLDPEIYLGFERLPAFTGNISAPYRLDCALTYRLPADQQPDFAPLDRVKNELSTQEWKAMLDKAWKAGVPHVIFTGGEPTLRPDLLELLEYVEVNGQVSGLISFGSGLSDQDYLNSLLNTGLDHLMLVLHPEQPVPEEIVKNVVAADLYTAIHLTLSPANQDTFLDQIRMLANLGVTAVSLTTADLALGDLLVAGRNQVAMLGIELVWNLPVPYSAANPIALERNRPEKPEGAGRAWLYVEPDGDVLPDQGILQPMGNLLTDTWESIWRQHKRMPVE
jgi:hypothetical protein